MSLGTTRFSAATAAGSNAKNRDTLICVLIVAAHLLSRSIIKFNPSSLERRDGALEPANAHAQRPDCEQREHPVRCSVWLDASISWQTSVSCDSRIADRLEHFVA